MSFLFWQLWRDVPVQQGILVALGIVVCAGVVSGRTDWHIWPWVVVWIWPAVKLGGDVHDVQRLGMLNAVITAPFAVGIVAGRSARGREALLGLSAGLLIVCGCGLGAVALVDHLSGWWPPVATRWAAGPFLSSNHLAAALAFGLVTTAVWALAKPSKLGTAACWIVGAFQVVLLLATRSRGALVGTVFALSVGAMMLRIPRRSRILLASCVALVVAGAVLYGPMRSRFGLVMGGSSPKGTEGLVPQMQSAHPERWMATRAAAAAISQCWLRGVEPTAMFGGILVEMPDGQVRRFSGCYTTSLNWAWRFGIPSATASAVLMVLSVVAGLRRRNVRIAGVAGGALALLVNSAVTDIWQHPLLAFGLSALSVLLWLDWRSTPAEYEASAPRVVRKVSVRKAAGFTLVEVLVVISILALLLAILLPAFGRSRRQARTVVCRTRIRSLGDCTAVYTGEFSRYPPSLMNTPGEWLAGWAGFDWLGVGHRGDRRELAPCSGLYWIYTRAADVYVCPQDEKGSGGHFGAFNFAMNGRTGLLVPGAYTRHRDKTQLPRLSDASLPVFFEEAGPREGCFSGRDVPSFRHGASTNVGFADGHVTGHVYGPGVNANDICRELDFDPPLVVVAE